MSIANPLNPENPLDTQDQRDLELQGVRMLKRAAVQESIAEIAAHWREAIYKSIPGPMQPALEQRFDESLEQVIFHGVVAGLNLDAGHPKVHSTPHWEHRINGVRIPGTMGGIPNPDAVYRFIPVDGEASFLVKGKFPKRQPLINEYSLVTKDFKTVGNISAAELKVSADGSFTITIDPKPANGRINHLQTTPDAVQLLIREMMADWSQEKSAFFEVERTGGAPVGSPKTDDELEPIVCQSLQKYVKDFIWASKLCLDKPANTLQSPEIYRGDASTGGFLVTQAYSMGRFFLEKGEALILSVELGGATYIVAPLSDYWSVTRDFTKHTVSYNITQATPDPDGSYSFVVAVEDPGVANWLDPEGVNEGLIFFRWAGFDPKRMAEANPRIATKVVKVSELAKNLPSGSPRADAAVRREQLAQRARDYAWRRKYRA